jgi:hypothetical protein
MMREVCPAPADLEAAIPRTAAESAFWSTLRAHSLRQQATHKAQSCAETALTLCELLDDKD